MDHEPAFALPHTQGHPTYPTTPPRHHNSLFACAHECTRSLNLYLMVCVTRYLDALYFLGSPDVMFDSTLHLYNTTGKVVFTGLAAASAWTAHTLKRQRPHSGPPEPLTPTQFRIGVIATLVAAAVLTAQYTAYEWLWTFSRLLEAWALLPQVLHLLRTGGAQQFVAGFLWLMGAYRIAYIGGWVHRYTADPDHFFTGTGRVLEIATGVIQAVLFVAAVAYVSWRRARDHRWVPDHIVVVVHGGGGGGGGDNDGGDTDDGGTRVHGSGFGPSTRDEWPQTRYAATGGIQATSAHSDDAGEQRQRLVAPRRRSSAGS